jgi:hypothetical protein
MDILFLPNIILELKAPSDFISQLVMFKNGISEGELSKFIFPIIYDMSSDKTKSLIKKDIRSLFEGPEKIKIALKSIKNEKNNNDLRKNEINFQEPKTTKQNESKDNNSNNLVSKFTKNNPEEKQTLNTHAFSKKTTEEKPLNKHQTNENIKEKYSAKFINKKDFIKEPLFNKLGESADLKKTFENIKHHNPNIFKQNNKILFHKEGNTNPSKDIFNNQKIEKDNQGQLTNNFLKLPQTQKTINHIKYFTALGYFALPYHIKNKIKASLLKSKKNKLQKVNKKEKTPKDKKDDKF